MTTRKDIRSTTTTSEKAIQPKAFMRHSNPVQHTVSTSFECGLDWTRGVSRAITTGPTIASQPSSKLSPPTSRQLMGIERLLLAGAIYATEDHRDNLTAATEAESDNGSKRSRSIIASLNSVWE